MFPDHFSQNDGKLVDFISLKKKPVKHNKSLRISSIMKDDNKRVKKRRKLSQSLVTNRRRDIEEFKPIRQYYHTRTNLPMLENEWDVDSDDCSDDGWLHENSKEVRNERKISY